jgi:acid phosphatase type 7
MRVMFAVIVSLGVLGAGCGEDPDDAPFSSEGGSLEIDGCDYTLSTRFGADIPRTAGDKIGTDPTPRYVHLGVMGDPTKSIVAQWRTVDETTTAGSIRYAAGENLAASQLKTVVKGVQFGYKATGQTIYRVHQAHVCDLSPGTAYSYQVGSGDSWSPVYTFRTAPDVEANPDAEVVVAVAGDTRAGLDVWGQLVAQLQQRNPDVLLFSGDAIVFGLVQEEWDAFLATSEPLFATVPVLFANGNHEASSITLFAQFAMPGDQESFGVSYGFSRVFVANDSPDPLSALTDTIPQAIDADFTEHASARWKVLMHHRPIYSSGEMHGGDSMLGAAWLPTIDKHHLDLVLNGHEHQFEMSKPLAGGVVQASTDTGTVYVIAGGGGAEQRTFGDVQPWLQYREIEYSAAIMRVRRTQLTLDSFHPDGTPVPATFTKTKL